MRRLIWSLLHCTLKGLVRVEFPSWHISHWPFVAWELPYSNCPCYIGMGNKAIPRQGGGIKPSVTTMPDANGCTAEAVPPDLA